MKKIFFLVIGFTALSLYAQSYYSEYRDDHQVIFFHGEIKDTDIGKVKVLQAKYLETIHPYGHHFKHTHSNDTIQYEHELNALGVTIETIPKNPDVDIGPRPQQHQHYYP